MAGYYRKFIPGISSIATPLLKLTQKAASFIWTDSCEQAFQRLKQLLCSAPILAYPDFGKNFVLQTDASDNGVGAVLSQLDDSGNEKVIAYASKALSPREQKYSTTEKEALAVVFGTGHFRVYLLSRHFKLITDRNALRWLQYHGSEGSFGALDYSPVPGPIFLARRCEKLGSRRLCMRMRLYPPRFCPILLIVNQETIIFKLDMENCIVIKSSSNLGRHLKLIIERNALRWLRH